MKKIIFLVVALLGAVSLNAQERSNYELLWRFKSPESQKWNYLLGTMHLNANEVFSFSDSVLVCFDRCDGAAFEINLDSANKVFVDMVADRINPVDLVFGESEEEANWDSFNKEDGEEVKKRLEILKKSHRKELGKEMYSREQTKVKESDFDDFLDAYLHKRAKFQQKPIVGLENIEAHLGLITNEDERDSAKKDDFSNIPPPPPPPPVLPLVEGQDLKIDSLIAHYLDSLEQVGFIPTFNPLERLVNLYYEGDLDSIHAQTSKRYFRRSADRLRLTERNYIHVESIKSLPNDSSFFVAVGVAHLPGEEGVIELLKSHGYQVEPVEASFTGMAEQGLKLNIEVGWNAFDYPNGVSLRTPQQMDRLNMEGLAGMKMYMYLDAGTGDMYLVGTSNIRVPGTEKEVLKAAVEEYENRTDLVILEVNKIKVGKLNARELIARIGFSEVRYVLFSQQGRVVVVGYTNQKTKALYSSNGDAFINSIRLDSEFEIKPVVWGKYASERGTYEMEVPGEMTMNQVVSEPYDEYSDPPSMIDASYVLFNDGENGGAFFVKEWTLPLGEFYVEGSDLFDFQDEFLSNTEFKAKVLTEEIKKVSNGISKRTTISSTEGNMELLLVNQGVRAMIVIGEMNDEGAKRFVDSFVVKPFEVTSAEYEIIDRGTFEMGQLMGQSDSPEQRNWLTESGIDSIFWYRSSNVDFSYSVDVQVFKLFELYEIEHPDSILKNCLMYTESYNSEILDSSFTTFQGLPSIEFTVKHGTVGMISKGRYVLNGNEVVGFSDLVPADQAMKPEVIAFRETFKINDVKKATEKLDLGQHLLKKVAFIDSANANSISREIQIANWKTEDVPELLEVFHLNLVDQREYGSVNLSALSALKSLNVKSLKDEIIKRAETAESNFFINQLVQTYIELDSTEMLSENTIKLLRNLKDVDEDETYFNGYTFYDRSELFESILPELGFLAQSENHVGGLLSAANRLSYSKGDPNRFQFLEEILFSKVGQAIDSLPKQDEDELRWQAYEEVQLLPVLAEVNPAKANEYLGFLTELVPADSYQSDILLSKLKLGVKLSNNEINSALNSFSLAMPFLNMVEDFQFDVKLPNETQTLSYKAGAALMFYLWNYEEYYYEKWKLLETESTELGEFYIFELTSEWDGVEYMGMGPINESTDLRSLEYDQIFYEDYEFYEEDSKVRIAKIRAQFKL